MKLETYNKKHRTQKSAPCVSRFMFQNLRFKFHDSRFKFHERGAALLATTLAVIIILLAMGLSMTSSGLFEGLMSQAQSDSKEAFAAAQSGIKDAHLRIARNKSFSSAGYFIPSDPSNCTLNSSSVCAKVIVEKDTASACSQAISAGQNCLIAAGTLRNTTRTIEVILNVNATNGKISQVSWKEI